MGTVNFFDQDHIDFVDRVNLAIILGQRPGNIYYVHSGNGLSTYDGTSSKTPKATLAQAVALCSPNRNDTVVVLPGHSETLASTTAGITLSVDGVNIVGMGFGSARPTFTAAAAAIDAVNITGDSVMVKGCKFVGATSCTALININAATDVIIDGNEFSHGAAPTDVITVVAASHRFKVINNMFIGTAAGPDACVTVEGVCNNWVVENNKGIYAGSAGLDEAFVDLGSNACLGFIVNGNVVCGIDTTFFDFNTSTSATAGDGIVSNNFFTAYTAIANIDTSIDAGGAGSVNNFCTDLAAERGAWVPVTSPA